MTGLVTNMGDPKEPWKDVPIEVIIEEERKRLEELERQRPRIHPPSPERYPKQDPDKENEESEKNDFKVVIKL